MGLETIMFEFASYPLNSLWGIIDNCLRAVEQRADILVLNVDGKYDFITKNGKSITNLEYLQAKEKGISLIRLLFQHFILAK